MTSTQSSDRAVLHNGANRGHLGADARPTGGGGQQSASAPSHDEIARRAYEIYVAKNRQPGQCVQNWRQAEDELRRSSSSASSGVDDEDGAFDGRRADSNRPGASSDLSLRSPVHPTPGSPFGRARAATDIKE